MSSERVVLNLISKLAFSFDGAILGVALAYGAVRSLINFTSDSAALRRLNQAPSISVADIRCLLLPDQSEASEEKLIVVRGTVEAKSAFSGNGDNVLMSQESGERAVIVQRTLTCIYNEWRGLLGWTSDLRSLFINRRRLESSSLRKVLRFLMGEIDEGVRNRIGMGRFKWEEGNTNFVWEMVSFVLVDGDERLIVNMDGSKHPLPLTTSYHKLQPVSASPYTFLQTVFGHEYPVGLLDEEKILPIGKDLNIVGVCHFKNGIPQIKSCKDLPYFLSDLTKDEMIVDLDLKTKTLFVVGISLGLLSVGVLGYAVVRNWNKWKEWRQQRQDQQANQAAAAAASAAEADSETGGADDETGGDVPEGELCVICLTRRKTSAFFPCGHMVCCHRCALLVEREVTPSCPVCRQPIRNSLRIYGS